MKKVYLPKWQRYYIFPVFGLILAAVTYMEFFSDQSEKMGLLGYLFFVGLFLFLSGMFYLMTSGRLPAYIIKDDDEKDDE